MRILGVILIALGVAGLVLKEVSWTQREEIVEVGPIKATADRKKSIPVPWYVGAGLIGAGTLMLLGGGGGRRR